MIAFGFGRPVAAAKRPYYGYPVPKLLIIAPRPVGKDMENGGLGFVFGKAAYQKSLELGALYKEIAEKNDAAFIDCQDLGFSINDNDYLH